MKKLFVVVVTGMLAFSCGSEVEEKEEWTVCKCHQEMQKIDNEMEKNGGSEEIVKKAKDVMKNCDKIQDEMGMDEFMKKKDECLN